MSEKHCPSCICGRRAPVQGDTARSREERVRGPGSISWAEHEQAWAIYAGKYGHGQSAQRIADRGGFSWAELVDLLGREPGTWAPERS